MSKLEVENRLDARPPPDGININPMPFRRPFPPQQILQRERRNLDDQRVQPPLNNYVDENQQSSGRAGRNKSGWWSFSG
jgi:hypothetical protein